MSEWTINYGAAFTAFLFLGGAAAAFFLFQAWKIPHLKFSSLSIFGGSKNSLKQKFAFLPRALGFLALILFTVAYIDPHTYVEKAKKDPIITNDRGIPTEGIAIYLVLDRSLSMSEELEGRGITKMDMLKDVTKRFVSGDKSLKLRGRPNDLIGVVAIARSAQVLSPLTLDHKEIVEILNKLNVLTDESQAGTALGYSIFKTSSLVEATRHFGQELVKEGKPSYEIKNSILVLVTDGFQEVNPEDANNTLRNIDLIDAANYAKKLGVKVYIINIDPSINSLEYADNRKYFKLLTQLTGGDFFYVDSSRGLSQIYAEIDQLEKGVIYDRSQVEKQNLPNLYQRLSLYPSLIAGGLFCLFLSILLNTTLLRRVP